MPTKTFIPLTNDILFKHVFSHKEIAQDLINSVFEYIGEDKNVSSIRLKKDKSMYGKSIHNKIFYGDIVAILNTEEYVSAEMYTSFGKEEYLKSLSYLSRLFGNQLKRGQKFIQAKKVYSINFMTGNYHRENNEIVNDYGFVRIIKNPKKDTNYLIMLLIRLDLISKMVYNDNEKRLIKWGRLMNAKSMDEMKKIAKEDEIMEAAIKYIDEFLENEGTTFEDKIEYEKTKAFDKGEKIGVKKGEKIGVKKGEKKGIFYTAKNMLKKGYTTKEIAEITKIPEIEIESLKNK